MQRVGLERWPGFLRAVAERAAAAPTRLAQAGPANVRSDASGTAASGIEGRLYTTKDLASWIGRPSVGSGECVALVQAATGAPRTAEWTMKIKVQGNTALPPGTAIAVPDANGRYGNHTDGTSHAALYVSQDEKGLTIIDQWNVRGADGKIDRSIAPHMHTIPRKDPKKIKLARERIIMSFSKRVIFSLIFLYPCISYANMKCPPSDNGHKLQESQISDGDPKDLYFVFPTYNVWELKYPAYSGDSYYIYCFYGKEGGSLSFKLPHSFTVCKDFPRIQIVCH